MRLRAVLVSGVVAVGLAGLSACGDEASTGGQTPTSSAGAGAPPQESDSAALEHIHGLGEDPKTGELFVATHVGLFRAAEGVQKLDRAGPSRQDTMGFSVVSADRFLGSGHPDPAAGGPPSLGLIASNDQGRSWETISLAGQVDFHVLRTSGRQVYGSDSGSGKLMVSGDGGRSWTTRTLPADLFDLAIDPEDPTRILASTAGGIFSSSDAAKTWTQADAGTAGLIAWPSAGTVVLVDGDGNTSLSSDGGRSFTPTGGSIGSPPAAFVATEAGLLAATGDGTVLQSTDAGKTWDVRARP